MFKTGEVRTQPIMCNTMWLVVTNTNNHGCGTTQQLAALSEELGTRSALNFAALTHRHLRNSLGRRLKAKLFGPIN